MLEPSAKWECTPPPPPPRVLITDAQKLVLLRAFKSLIGTVNINQEAIYVY